MKCAQIYPYFTHPSAYALAKGLIGKGWEITVYCCPSERELPVCDHLKIVHIPSLFELAGYIPFSAPTKISLKEIDLVNIHEDFYLNSLYAMISAKFLHNVPIVLTEHYYPAKGKYLPWAYFLSGVHLTVGWSVIKRSDLYIALSRRTKKHLMERGVAEEKISVIGNPVDTEFFSPEIQASSDSFCDIRNLRCENIIILYVGRLLELKGVYDLLTAFSILRKRFPQTVLIFAGSGSDSYNLKKYVATAGLENSVMFLGQVPHDDLPALYNLSDIFVLPSHIELFSSACLEAMACGKPVIGTNVGGFPDIIEDGFNGFTVPPQNPGILSQKLMELSADSEKREKFGKRSREIAISRFSCENVVSKTNSVLEKALGLKCR